MGDEIPEFQPGDLLEVAIPIEHTANLTAVRAAFVHEQYPHDVRFELDARLTAGDEAGTTVATFTLRIPRRDQWRGEYKMTMLVVDTAGGRSNIVVEDAPVIRFKIVPERTGHLRANGFEMRRLD